MTMYSSFNCGQLSVFIGISFALLLANAFPQDLSSPSESTDKESLNISNEPNDIKFLLFPDALNSNYSEEITFDDLASLTESSFVPHIQTILITHGFRSDASSLSCQNVKNALLSYSSQDANIIIVDWKALATPTPISYALNWGPCHGESRKTSPGRL
ncbi:unnamed protein product [Orchesella dallaii]|uniref:Lipase domain-containing protein n=1 Tax=Orchesella dallaii TaxID=48710 RepID=A0ABP1QH70_9HEXA